jgi:hypothetical protein
MRDIVALFPLNSLNKFKFHFFCGRLESDDVKTSTRCRGSKLHLRIWLMFYSFVVLEGSGACMKPRNYGETLLHYSRDDGWWLRWGLMGSDVQEVC